MKPLRACLVLAVVSGGPVQAQTESQVFSIPQPEPVLHIMIGDEELPVLPWDIDALEISESGGITDIFVRLAPAASESHAAMVQSDRDMDLGVRVCGVMLLDTVVQGRVAPGTLYLPGTTAVRAEAVRALWHGRARCDTVAPEVFEHGN